MGTKLKDIVLKNEVDFTDLKGKKFAVDSFNVLYQFLATIRQRDGALLKDSNGQVTSHLIGLFSRTTKLMQKGLKLAFVFDGVAPELKAKERLRRAKVKNEAALKHDLAEKEGNLDDMKKYAARTSRLTPEMVKEAKDLVSALGLPVIQAPSEGEAQAAYIVEKGEVYAAVSQDYDSLLFGVPKLIQNLTLTDRKKLPGKLAYSIVRPQLLDLIENLNNLGIDRDQLIVLGILVGTDFNIGGIPGIGPKKALNLLKKHGKDFDALFEEVKWNEHFEFEWTEPYYLIKKMPTTDDYELEWKDINSEKVFEVLCDRHDFSRERVENTLSKLKKEQRKNSQKGLDQWFG